jgi:hypothetical protein
VFERVSEAASTRVTIRRFSQGLPDQTPEKKAAADGVLNRVLSLTLMHQRFGMSV